MSNLSIKTKARVAVLNTRTKINRVTNSAVEGVNNFVQARVVAGLTALDAKQDARFVLFMEEGARINREAEAKENALKSALDNVEVSRTAAIAELRTATQV